ncbi:CC50A protein, partial [Polypterus senegalus]
MASKATSPKPVPFAKRPDNSAFKQQKLPAWYPALTAVTVLPFFFLTGLACVLIGIWLFLTAAGIKQITNPSSLCAPFDKYKNGTPIAPCGAVANSMFNDTLRLLYKKDKNTQIVVPFLNYGIAWYTDKNVKFQNPLPKNNLSAAFQGTGRPYYWQKTVYELDVQNSDNNGFVNEDLIVWMREAAFPSFKKLYRRLNCSQEFSNGLPLGNYSLWITYISGYVTCAITKELVPTTEVVPPAGQCCPTFIMRKNQTFERMIPDDMNAEMFLANDMKILLSADPSETTLPKNCIFKAACPEVSPYKHVIPSGIGLVHTPPRFVAPRFFTKSSQSPFQLNRATTAKQGDGVMTKASVNEEELSTPKRLYSGKKQSGSYIHRYSSNKSQLTSHSPKEDRLDAAERKSFNSQNISRQDRHLNRSLKMKRTSQLPVHGDKIKIVQLSRAFAVNYFNNQSKASLTAGDEALEICVDHVIKVCKQEELELEILEKQLRHKEDQLRLKKFQQKENRSKRMLFSNMKTSLQQTILSEKEQLDDLKRQKRDLQRNMKHDKPDMKIKGAWFRRGNGDLTYGTMLTFSFPQSFGRYHMPCFSERKETIMM